MSDTYPSLRFTTFPEQVQTFVTMLNMTIADGPAIKGYQKAMQNGNNELAKKYYAQITNANRKFIDSTKMNRLMDTCVALQKFYLTDIKPYIENLQTEWNDNVSRFNYLGDYSSSVSYNVNNFVTYTYGGVRHVYICIKKPPIGTSPSRTTYWRRLSVRGLQGVSGENLSFRYDWKSDQTYYEQDVVVYNNTVWGCLVQNSNKTPQSGSTYWEAIYSPEQVVYPFSSQEPTNMQVGYLWFKIK